jgi:DNA topoisomerase IB
MCISLVSRGILDSCDVALKHQKEGVKIEKLSKCDFKPMFEYFEREKEKKKTMTKEEKKQ